LLTNKQKVTKYKCENDFLFFVRYFFKKRFGYKFIVNSHHQLISDTLTRVVDGEITRLVINMPPRYGKTEMAVICFIAWCIARNSSSKFIHLSYSDDLALDNSAQVKELVQTDEFQEIWPIELKKDSKSNKKWYTESRGGVYATAAGGAVTGFGAGSTNTGEFGGAIIIDDPLKVDDADSPKQRDRVNKRLNTTIKSRVNSRETPIILIMQRVHDEDASGFVLDNGTNEEWEHLNISAEVSDGVALWPWKHTWEELQVMRKADKYTYSGQYLQEPVPDDGVYFTKDSFRWYDKAPENLNHYGASDYAVTEGGGDFTEHGVFGIDPNDDIYIVDWWGGQTKSNTWIEEQLDLVQKYNVLKWAGETGPIRAAVLPFLELRMRQRRAFTILEWFSHSANNKEANARTFQALVEAGKVYLPKNEPWATELVNQLVRFPLGKYDDKVDACSLFARMINALWGATIDQEREHEPCDRYDRAFDEDYEEDSWKLA